MLSTFRSSPSAKSEALRAIARSNGRPGGAKGSSSGVSLPLLTSGLGGAPGPLMVEKTQLVMCMSNIQHSPTQGVVLRKILSDMIDPGYEMYVSYENERYDFPPSEQETQQTIWKLFAAECHKYIMGIGMVVVGTDTRGDGVTLPRVIPVSFINICFAEGPDFARIYWIERADSSAVVLEATLYVANPPDEYGNLTSPASKLLVDARRAERMLSNHEHASFHSAHPCWVMQNSAKGLPRRGVDEGDTYTEGDTDQIYAEFVQVQQQRDITALDQMKKASTENYQRGMQQLLQNPAYNNMPAGLGNVPPFVHHFITPVDTTVASPPRPIFDPVLVSELERIERNVMHAFGVPPSLMDVGKSSARFSSQSDAGMVQYFNMIANQQNQLATLLTDAYKRFCGNVFADFAKAILGAHLGESSVLNERPLPNARSGARRSRRKLASDSDSDSSRSSESSKSSNRGRRKRSTRSDDDDEPSVSGDEDEVAAIEEQENGDMQIQDTDASIKRAAIIGDVADIQSLENQVRQGLRLEILFNRRAMADQAGVLELVKELMMSRENAAALIADQAGIPRSRMLLKKEDAEAEAKNRKKLADLITPESEKKPKEAPASSANKKPAGSSAGVAKSKNKKSAASSSKASSKPAAGGKPKSPAKASAKPSAKSAASASSSSSPTPKSKASPRSKPNPSKDNGSEDDNDSADDKSTTRQKRAEAEQRKKGKDSDSDDDSKRGKSSDDDSNAKERKRRPKRSN